MVNFDFKYSDVLLSGSWTVGPSVEIAPVPASTTTQAGTPFEKDIAAKLKKVAPASESLGGAQLRVEWMPVHITSEIHREHYIEIDTNRPSKMGIFGSFGGGQGGAVLPGHYSWEAGLKASFRLTPVVAVNEHYYENIVQTLYPVDLGLSIGLAGHYLDGNGHPPGTTVAQNMDGEIHTIKATVDFTGPFKAGFFWRAGVGFTIMPSTTLGNQIPVSSDVPLTGSLGLGWGPETASPFRKDIPRP